MAERDRRIEDLAGAILDGGSIDWAYEESSADVSERSLLDQLRLVAAVADAHRRPRPSKPSDARRVVEPLREHGVDTLLAKRSGSPSLPATAFLDRRCKGDPDLRSAVDRLLHERERPGVRQVRRCVRRPARAGAIAGTGIS